MKGILILEFVDVEGTLVCNLNFDLSIAVLYKLFKYGVDIMARMGDIDCLVTEFNDNDGVISAFGVDNSAGSAVSFLIHEDDDDATKLIIEMGD